ncbi:hypothetical protein KP509_05G053600 [Ceratopteris richardii]|uniref:Uncharacterized protein n=1 Tax=Ceratopteris richardii TaxID=49495 RepID=A0A8T2UTE4_CERRI|nr:hypothetical protein KP509_05G053600 [Ceratopteris richardii]
MQQRSSCLMPFSFYSPLLQRYSSFRTILMRFEYAERLLENFSRMRVADHKLEGWDYAKFST